MSFISITRLKLAQPKTKKKVIELQIGGWIGTKMRNLNWGACTIPGPFMVFILYWVSPLHPQPYSWVRLHEFCHVKQDEGNLFFLVSWIKYGWELLKKLSLKTLFTKPYQAYMDAYAQNKYEVQAYAEEADALMNLPLPDWTQVP